MNVPQNNETKVSLDQLAARALRHKAAPPVLILRSLLSPQKRAYMKRFGSRPVSKTRKRETVLS